MTKREEKLIRKYAKAVNIDAKIVKKLYEHGDENQRQIDYIGMEATLLLRQAKSEGKIKTDKKGKITKKSQEQLNIILQSYLATKKYVPDFFKKPLPIIVKEKQVSLAV